MSIVHKAYLFDFRGFERELAGIVYEALKRDDVRRLRTFIQRHRAELTDFSTEEPPGEDWEERILSEGGGNTQWYADLALTRFYDFTDDLGLGYGFDALHAFLRTVPTVGDSADDLICGRVFGPKGQRLDPGAMGTGLLSPEDVKQLHGLLEQTDWPPVPAPRSRVWAGCHYKPQSADEVRRSLTSLRGLYRLAAERARGLLLVDFNDRGVAAL
jgi:hypothetical protein